jgi:hypothetical protein
MVLASSATDAPACSTVPPHASLGLSVEELDEAARRMLDGATAVVEGTVVRRPYFRPQRGRARASGLLRVDRVLSGTAPATVETRWHPCGTFGHVGRRMTVVLHPRNGPDYAHPDIAAAIRRLLRGG